VLRNPDWALLLVVVFALIVIVMLIVIVVVTRGSAAPTRSHRARGRASRVPGRRLAVVVHQPATAALRTRRAV
jgi:hypothetical protein